MFIVVLLFLILKFNKVNPILFSLSKIKRLVVYSLDSCCTSFTCNKPQVGEIKTLLNMN